MNRGATTMPSDSGAAHGEPSPPEPAPTNPAPTEPAPTEAGVLDTAKAFVAAVIWGEHLTLWDLLSSEARRLVLRTAVNRGMDEALSARLRDGTAARGERDLFLTDLVNGLRADLRGNDLDSLNYELDTTFGDEKAGTPDDKASGSSGRVMLLAPMLAGLGAPLPVASMELVRDGDRWRVDRLLPRTNK